MKVQSTKDGPNILTGVESVETPDGKVMTPEGAKCALCACGKSGTKPFCDGAHAKK